MHTQYRAHRRIPDWLVQGPSAGACCACPHFTSQVTRQAGAWVLPPQSSNVCTVLPGRCLFLLRKMQTPNDKKPEKLEPFYRPSVSRRKTSAEIINEARSSLRSIRTQRPFTPREEQRKLFGSATSRTLENRPLSSFSLHASSFESPDCKPISGTRLIPLEHKPKVLSSSTKEEDASISFPKPPVDPVKIRRVSCARASLFKAASRGNILPDRRFQLEESKKRLNSEEPGHSLQLTDGVDRNETQKQDGVSRSVASFSSHLRSGGNQMKNQNHIGASACRRNSNQSKSETKPGLDLRENETEEEETYWNSRILPILRELEMEGNIENICTACTSLHQALEEGNMLGRRFKRRTILLKTLYKLVDIGSDLLDLKLAKTILALKVSGKNLLNVCKLIFKISRSEKNDSLIQNESILESLLEVLRVEDLLTNIEAFLYCMGAIKFVSGNPGLLSEMVSKGAVEILLQLIKKINGSPQKTGTCLLNADHLLVQITATIRNLVDLPLVRYKFLSNSALPELCLVMEQHTGDKDVCTNIARIFSKLSSYRDCCAALATCSTCYTSLLVLLDKYPRKQDLVVRIVFVLGNLTATNNQAREQFAKERGCIQTLLSLFRTYCELDLNSKKWNGEGEDPHRTPKQPSEVEDVLIKVLRILANVSIHPNVGAALATDQRIVASLLTILECKSIDDCEELVINATAAINNLSFYRVSNSVIRDKKLLIAELLLKLLMSSNMDGILEAVRVFGNLSHYHEICDFLVQKNVYKFVIALLDARHQDVCFFACGVLLNLTVEKDKRVILKEGGGIQKLVDCLRDFGPTDWQLACLVCKTLWNYSENITSAASCFGEEVTTTLLALLSSFLDEDLALEQSLDGALRDHHRFYWEREFKPVAQQLLSRLQRCHPPFPEPISSF
ncbi:armadillo repeat-containing protein 2 isoform X2 [Tachyglossus aculeatus]|uniref:armadillo repeat-containing protein 2 isoform X2 n=1 Tax=Tachyglossus aculeatus TaxID=9261 RepID=UPI0018F75909|nr:armadillo repeat-containing protein 2 isoform X2 [Tachyglossus aculeatus]